MPDKPLRDTLAEIKEAQHRPQQEIQRIVSQIAFEPILHRAVAYLKPGRLHLLDSRFRFLCVRESLDRFPLLIDTIPKQKIY